MNFARFSLTGRALTMAALLLTGCVTPPIIPSDLVTDPGQAGNACPDGVISFQYEVLPAIVSGCAMKGCHDAKSRREGVVLDSYDNIMKQVVAGNPNSSRLYRSMNRFGEELMPPRPEGPWPSDKIALIRDWIKQGAQETTCGDNCVDTEDSFAANIYPTMQTYCIGCHSSSNKQGGINLDGYELIKSVASSGRLMGSVNHQSGYVAMPPSGNLSDCRITQLQNWIDAGMPQN